MLLITTIPPMVSDNDSIVIVDVFDAVQLFGPPTRGISYIREDSTEVAIGNDNVELVFSKATGCGLDKILDKSTGEDLRSNKIPAAIMFFIFYWNGATLDLAIQWDASGLDITNETGTGYAKLVFNYTLIKGADLNVTVTMEISDNSSFVRMRIDVENDEPSYVLKSVYFPVIWGLGAIGPDTANDHLFYPVGDGLVIEEPLQDLDTLYLGDMYPATVSAQVMSYYDPDIAGLYMATYDDQGNPKKPEFAGMDWAAQRHLSGHIQMYVPESGGNDFTMEYDAAVGTFHGDWYDMADIYKDWALTTPFISGGKVYENKDIPFWWHNTSIISMANRDNPKIEANSLSRMTNVSREFHNVTGLNTTSLIFGWEGKGAWVGPYYYPPVEGNQSFMNAMSDMAKVGGRGFTYISGTVWRINRSDIGVEMWDEWNTTGIKWAAINESGGEMYDPFYPSG
jgi:hypothetical protein